MKGKLLKSLVAVLLGVALLVPGLVSAQPATPTGLTKISPDNNPLPAFKWDAVTGATSYEVRVDSGAWMNIGNRLTYVQPTVLSKGSHTFAVRAKDGAGNAGPWASLSFNVSVVADLACTKIAYTSGWPNSEIYIMNVDFTSKAQLTNTPGLESVGSWSPDGTKIAFGSDRDGNFEIYVMNAAGSAQTRLTNNTAHDAEPAWSPDGSKIAFHSNRDGNYEIYVMNADGSAQTRITNNSAGDAYPAWSPDGTRIVFSSSRDGNPEIYVMNADGSGQIRLTFNSAEDGYPAWSPDGLKIAFYSNRDSDTGDIHIMNADGSNQTRITQISPEGFFIPKWSPDSTELAFSYYETVSHPYTIGLMNADGTGKNILTTGYPNGGPSWSPFLVDTTPPQISVSVSPDMLWPPDHKMVDITATVTVSDACDPAPSIVLASVVSNEPDDAIGNGDGNTVNDIRGADIGTEDYAFSVRAERAAGGSGRVYTITYTATDASGNSASASATVIVPHDRR